MIFCGDMLQLNKNNMHNLCPKITERKVHTNEKGRPATSIFQNQIQ